MPTKKAKTSKALMVKTTKIEPTKQLMVKTTKLSGDSNKMSAPAMRAASSLKSESTTYKQAVGKVKKDGSVKMFKNPRKPKKY